MQTVSSDNDNNNKRKSTLDKPGAPPINQQITPMSDNDQNINNYFNALHNPQQININHHDNKKVLNDMKSSPLPNGWRVNTDKMKNGYVEFTSTYS